MRIFVTGGTGFIGAAVIAELVGAGHAVLALGRSDASAASLAAIGAEPFRGDLSDADSLTAGAVQCDGVIHSAFDNSDLHGWAAKDRDIVTTFANALAGSGKALVMSSVVAIVEPGKLASEVERAVRDSIGGFRAESEAAAKDAAERDVRSAIIRLPPTVHGTGDRMFLPGLIDVARRTGVSAYVEQGSNRWPAVHRLDAARLYRLAFEQGAPGECFHAVAEPGIAFRAIAQGIGDRFGLPVRSIARADAEAQFGGLARFVGMDCPASSDITRSRLGWVPREADLLTDLRDGGYF